MAEGCGWVKRVRDWSTKFTGSEEGVEDTAVVVDCEC